MIYPPQLTLQLRKKQLISINPDPVFGFNVIYAGPNPMSLAATPANEDTTWHDFTNFVDGLQKIELSWSTTYNTTGEVELGQFRPKRGISGNLVFETEAKEFIKAHLVDAVAGAFNEIEARITDSTTGSYENYVMKASDLSWCEFNALCVFDISLRQADFAIQCIERTMIADNWQGWFQNEPKDIPNTPTGGVAPDKFHPRFSYCIERRPNGVLVLEWMAMCIIGSLYTLIYTVMYPMLFVLVTIINVMIAVINFITSLPIIGGTPITPIATPPPPTAILSGFSIIMIEAAGCGREHPAPLIRDYISNVCDKCGVAYDSKSIDIFFAPSLTITHSDGNSYTEPNPHYNATYFFPSVERGIRRFRAFSLTTGFFTPDTTTYYQPNNQPVLALSDFLDQLKKVYNARWEVKNSINPLSGMPQPTLWFKRKDFWKDATPLYDFSAGGADRSKLVEGICYTQSEYTVPASQGVLYTDDSADKCGHEATLQYNGTPLSFNNTIVDPHFYGILDKDSGFGATKFNNDGASTSYLYDALQTCWNIAFIGGFSLSDLGDMMRDYADFAVLLQTETITKPKIIIWDGKITTSGTPFSINPYLNARAMRNDIIIAGTTYVLGHTAWPGTYPGITTPSPNPVYPYMKPPAKSILTTLAAPSTIPATFPDNTWGYVNQPKTNVLGNPSSAPGVYTVEDHFGIVRSQNSAILVNYPMYFTPYFWGSLFDLFHWIDSPYRNPQLHKTWKLKIPLCKADIDKLQLVGDGSNVKLLGSVLLDTIYLNIGVITAITITYDAGENNGTGATIELSGYV